MIPVSKISAPDFAYGTNPSHPILVRYVVAWELDQTLDIPFVLEYLERAFQTGAPSILNNDKGSHFTSDSYLERLRSRNIQISMDGS